MMKKDKIEEATAQGVVLCGTSLRRSSWAQSRPPWSKQQGKESGRAAHVSLRLSSRCRVIDSKLSAKSTNQKQEPGHMGGIDQ